ncbi:MAG TPA: hypothetical protein VKB37_10320 [Jatrophihabitantaceae bacterium]|jgi:hypothetical protein|nr:hypothetical protein [Jatrophihabitantaceae bacterium]
MENLIAERRVKARDLHPGDIVRQYDWLLHIREVIVGRTAVAVAVTEFDFQLHYAADAQLPVPRLSVPPSQEYASGHEGRGGVAG